MVILWIILSIVFIFVLIFCTFFVFPWFFGAPYDITRRNALENTIKLVNPQKNDFIAELGSGDGRVCIALAVKNPEAKIHGFEINPFLVLISRKKIKKLNLQNSIKIHWKNFWRVNLSKYNKIVFFQFRSITRKLEKKFDKELRKGSKIISHNWKLPNWKICKKLGKKGLLEGEVYEYER